METTTNVISWIDWPINFSKENFPLICDLKAENVNGDWYVSNTTSNSKFRDAVKDAINDHLNRPVGEDVFFKHSDHESFVFRVSKPAYTQEWYVMVFHQK